MKRLAYGFAGAVAWVFVASFLMCYGRGQMAEFVFPYDQWLVAAWWWRSMLWMPHGSMQWVTHPLPWFILSGMIPTVVAGAGIWRAATRREPTNKLYGDGAWAGAADLSSGKIRQRRF